MDYFIDGLFIFFCVFIAIFGLLAISEIVNIYSDGQKEKIIEHSEDYIVYQECIELNDIYYCKIEN